MKRGKLIVLEGIDGSGTTTQVEKLAKYLVEEKGCLVWQTFEPTDSRLGKEIKRRLQEDKAAGIEPAEKGEWYTEMYVKDRKEHVKEIEKCLARGEWVVCDRYKYSTLAYQRAQGQELGELIKKHEGMLVPDLVVLLDLPAEEALERREGEEGVRPELFAKLEFLEKVRRNYLALKERLGKPRHTRYTRAGGGEKIVVIDGSGSVEEVYKAVVREVERLF